MLVSIPREILKQVIKDCIYRRLEENTEMRNSQHGCTKSRSCPTHHISFHDRDEEEQT